MVFFLQSDVARLVLGYLKENKYPETYSCFLKECSHLSECYELLKSGAQFDTTVFGFSLLLILEEWGRCRQQGHIQSATDPKKSHTHHRSSEISHSNRGHVKNTSRYEKKTPPNRRAIPTTWVSVDDTADSALDSDDAGLASNIHSLDVDVHHGVISSEDEEYIVSQSKTGVRSRFHGSKSPVRPSSNRQALVRIQKHKSPVRRTHSLSPKKQSATLSLSPRKQLTTHSVSPRKQLNVQFSDDLSGLTLLQSDNPGKSRLSTGEDKYPNLVNLLQFSSGNKTNTEKVSLVTSTVTQTTTSYVEVISLVSEDQPGTSGQTDNVCTNKIGPATQGSLDTTTATSTAPQSHGNSQSSKRLEFTDTPIAVHKTPSKTSRSPQKSASSLFTPNKLFQDGELTTSTRSPRRKKPKTPRKRHSDVSPTISQKDASGSEDRLPLFQQVLSDRRLHEKLAETCNIVSGQLKLSMSGSSESGDKPKSLTPPREDVSEQKQCAITASKSLEEVLDIDTNYATEFLSEKIDMSDPAFECLFKLFGTDKESFSENLRKENQQAEKETAKLTKDLEDLERSLHEEFGTTEAHQLHHVIHKDNVTCSQELHPGSVQVTGHPSSSQPASPYVSQAVCHSPYIPDGGADCMTGDRVNNFTPLVRGNDLAGSIYSTPSHKSTYSNGQYVSSPASVATQPFSPYHSLSPGNHPSPRSHAETPGTPVTDIPPGTPDSQMDHPNSPFIAGQHIRDDQLQLTPSHRSFSNDINSQSTPRQSSQSLLPHCSPSLPPNCSPLVKADIVVGSPVMSQKNGPLAPQNGPFTPQARKRIFNPINSTQLFLSPQMYPLSGQPAVDTSLHEGSVIYQEHGTVTSVPGEGQPIHDGDVTLTDANCENPVTLSASDPNHLVFNSLVTDHVNNYSNPQHYYEKSTLLGNIYHEDGSTYDKGECSTIVNSIGCISLPQPTETELPSQTNGEQAVKKKRSTRSDKGKKRKKGTTENGVEFNEAGLPVLKGLLTTQVQTGGVLADSTTLTPQDFENQELVMLSPGGSSTLKFPLLKCVDAPSSPANCSITSIPENQTERCEGASIMPENQVTSALMKSIASGNSTEILKQARTIAEVTSNDNKKKPPVKKVRKSKEKTNEPQPETSNTNIEGGLTVEPGDILTATPVQFLKKVHVRTLDFENQFKKIRPKPILPDTSTSAVIIVNPIVPTDSVIQNGAPTPANCDTKATASNNGKTSEICSVTTSSNKANCDSLSTNNVCTTTNSHKAKLTNDKPNSSDSSTKGKSTTKCDDLSKDKTSLITKTTTHDKPEGATDNVDNKVPDSKCVSPEEVKGRRCTRSSKPATMERLNDKGLPEKVIETESVPSTSTTTTTMGSKLYRRKPKSGKDMRVIMKHLRTMEDEDDVFSDFTESSMDSIASMKSPLSVASMKSPNSVPGNRSPTSMTGFKSPSSVASIMSPTTQPDIESQNGECVGEKSSGVTDKCSVVLQRSDANVQTKGKKEDVSETKKSPLKDKRNQKAPRHRKNSGNDLKNNKKKSSKNAVEKSATEVIVQTDSSEDDVPLIKLKEKIVEVNVPSVSNINNGKDSVDYKRRLPAPDKSKMNKDKTSHKERTDKKKVSEKVSKENKEIIPRTPPRSPVSPRRTSPSDVFTPNKEVWMEKVGLTPTKTITNSPHFMSPGRLNPLDVLAACQNSPLSDRKRCYTPNTRNRFTSPFKSPSGVRRRTPVKKLFDTTLPEKRPHVIDSDNMCTHDEVDSMIRKLQDNNPNTNLVSKVSSGVSSEKGVVVVESNTDIRKQNKDKIDIESKMKKNGGSKKSKKSKKHEKKEETSLEMEDSLKKKKKSSKKNSKSKVTKHSDSDKVLEIQSHETEAGVVNSTMNTASEITDNHPHTSQQVEHSEELSDVLEKSVQETCAATDFLMKELESDQNIFEESDNHIIISDHEVLENVTITDNEMNPINQQQNSDGHKTTETDRTAKDKTSSTSKSNTVRQENHSNALRKEKSQSSHLGDNSNTCRSDNHHTVTERGDNNHTSETTNNDNSVHPTGNLMEKLGQDATCETNTGENCVREQTSVDLTKKHSIRDEIVDQREVNPSNPSLLENQREIIQTPTLEIQTPVVAGHSGSSHHRHSSGKKKKRKSKKRHREESPEGGDEERHKKKRRKHHKHKHHKKHRKSAELSSLNVDAALSQLYTPSAIPAGSPPRISNSGDHRTSPVRHTTSEPQGTPIINNHLVKVSSQDHPLQHSTPIVNNNLVKQGAFGTMFSPVNENLN